MASLKLLDVITNSGAPFKVYLTFHSYGQVIIFPYAFSNKLCPDYMNLLGGATVMSKAIYQCSGRIYKVGISTDIMYYAAGTSTDWSHGVARIPYCYLIELGPKRHKFCLPEIEIYDYCQEVLAAIKALMEYIDEMSLKSNLHSEENYCKI
ncbi:Carboxypeptidase B [Eumeta japonica]|uniref:Carboxypeptidase B n=1 Tax=Eumeta variegata TaxID=151549 RepID=A0A4C1WK09_EUMVA|nr:Carboxypeptidase B [Eumeta japonica]